jgi:hypothetical protein
MTDSVKLVWIHSIHKVKRRWKGLSDSQKRRVLDALPDELNEEIMLKIIKQVRSETVTDADLVYGPARHGSQYGGLCN